MPRFGMLAATRPPIRHTKASTLVRDGNRIKYFPLASRRSSLQGPSGPFSLQDSPFIALDWGWTLSSSAHLLGPASRLACPGRAQGEPASRESRERGVVLTNFNLKIVARYSR